MSDRLRESIHKVYTKYTQSLHKVYTKPLRKPLLLFQKLPKKPYPDPLQKGRRCIVMRRKLNVCYFSPLLIPNILSARLMNQFARLMNQFARLMNQFARLMNQFARLIPLLFGECRGGALCILV